MSTPPRTKLSYRAKSVLQEFYTGGPALLSPKGVLACACGDEVKVLDVASGSVQRTLAGDSEPITALAFSPSGRHLYAASRSLQLRRYDADSGARLRAWRAHTAPVAALALDGAGDLLASGSADRSVRVWDAEAGYCSHAFHGHTGVVLQVCFHPKQMMLISAGDDAEVRVWDLVDRKCVAVMKGHFSAVTSLSLSPDGWTLLSAGRDKVVNLWSLRDYSKLGTVPIHEALEGAVIIPPKSPLLAAIGSGAAVPKGCIHFATGGEQGMLKFWRSDTGKCLREEATGFGGPGSVTDVFLTPDARGVVAVTSDSRLLFYGLQEAEGAKQPRLALGTQLVGDLDEVTDVRLLGPPDQLPTHVAVATNSEAIHIFTTADLSCCSTLRGHTDTVLTLDAWTRPGPSPGPAAQQPEAPSPSTAPPSGALLASGAKDGWVRVWEAGGGACVAGLEGHAGAVTAVAFARRAGKMLVSGGADRLLKVWDTSGLVAGELPAAQQALRALAAVVAHDKDINCVAVSPNDALVASGSQDRTIKLWRLPSLVCAATLRGHRRGVWAAEFSPVDQALATCSGDRTVKLWSVADGSCLRTFEGHAASVLRVAFLTAGTQLATTSADGLLKLWSVASSECVATFEGHEDKVWALARGGPAEAWLASGGADGRVTLWEDCTEEEATAAAAAEEDAVLQAQAAANALQDGDYAEAARLAFQLRQPGRVLAVLRQALGTGGGGDEQPGVQGAAVLRRLVAEAAGRPEELRQWLEWCGEWNTRARDCQVAQALLHALLQKYPPKVLLEVPGISEALEAGVAYTQRHYARLDRLLRASYLLDFTLASANALLPAGEAAAEAQANGAAMEVEEEEG